MAVVYEKQHVDFTLSLYRKGLSWPQISTQFNQKFKAKTNGDQLGKTMRRKQEFLEAALIHDKTRTGIGTIEKNRSGVRSETMFITAITPEYGISEKGTTHPGFMKAIETFLQHTTNSKLYILPMRSHNRPMQAQDLVYDKLAMSYRSRFVTDMTINDKIKIFDARLNPQAISPLTGLHHIQDGSPGYLFRQEDKSGDIGHYVKNKRPSMIIAHTKQLMESMPTGKNTLPRIFHTTGSCSVPDYRLDERIGKISHSMHTLGGLVVEIVGKHFFFRAVQANLITGEFVDMGYRYHADGRVVEERPLIMKPGDRHTGETDDNAIAATYEQGIHLNPEEVIWEDYMSWNSMNPHLWNKPDDRLRLPEYFRTIEAERLIGQKAIRADIDNFPQNTKHIINDCNHHRFILDWIAARRYTKEDHNAKIGHLLQIAVDKGINPTQLLIDSDEPDLLKALANGFNSEMEYLKKGDSYLVEGVENGEHGHNGLRGGKGTKNSHYLSYGKANVGHAHSSSIYNGIYTTGANAEYIQDYSKGQAITTLHSNCFQYRGGHRQLIIEIGGRWGRNV